MTDLHAQMVVVFIVGTALGVSFVFGSSRAAARCNLDLAPPPRSSPVPAGGGAFRRAIADLWPTWRRIWCTALKSSSRRLGNGFPGSVTRSVSDLTEDACTGSRQNSPRG